MSERLDELQRRFDAALDDDNEDPLSLGELYELCCLQGDEIDRLRNERNEAQQQLNAIYDAVRERHVVYAELPLVNRVQAVCDLATNMRQERDEARDAARFLLENAEDVAAGRCFGLSQAWPWLEE